MWFFWMEAYLCIFLSFVYTCIAVGDPVIKRGGLRSSYQEGRVRILLTGLTLPLFCACTKQLDSNPLNDKSCYNCRYPYSSCLFLEIVAHVSRTELSLWKAGQMTSREFHLFKFTRWLTLLLVLKITFSEGAMVFSANMK
jgi:hypothetical protein